MDPPELALTWAELAPRCGLAPAAREPRLLLALSGGADSVFLAHVLARARPRPPLEVAHVDHGLRGAASRADAEFCADLCRTLELPFHLRRIALDPGPSLEARARTLRYRALAELARERGAGALVTAHQADDVLETLLLRWVRGTELAGLSGLRSRSLLGAVLDPGARAGERLLLLRPLLGLSRAQIRARLARSGLAWREDVTNAAPVAARNRARAELLPLLEAAGGERLRPALLSFARAVAELEDELSRAAAALAWRPPAFEAARRAPADQGLGGRLERSQLMQFAPALRARVLRELLVRASGHAPRRETLERLSRALSQGRGGRFALPGGWTAWLRSRELELLPPPGETGTLPGERERQLRLFEDPDGRRQRSGGSREAREPRRLPVPGLVELGDGRAIRAELTSAAPGERPPRSPARVELDADMLGTLAADLYVRWPRAGDRFHGLGAPGAKALSRFLADAGVPREERAVLPLVCAAGEILWVVGVRPCERLRVTPRTRRRLSLELFLPAARCGAGRSRLPRPSAAE